MKGMKSENLKETVMKAGLENRIGNSYLAQVVSLTLVAVSLAVGVGIADDGGSWGGHHMTQEQRQAFRTCLAEKKVQPLTREQREAGQEPSPTEKAAFKACHKEVLGEGASQAPAQQ